MDSRRDIRHATTVEKLLREHGVGPVRSPSTRSHHVDIDLEYLCSGALGRSLEIVPENDSSVSDSRYSHVLAASRVGNCYVTYVRPSISWGSSSGGIVSVTDAGPGFSACA